jgi:hypothetical protein
MTSSTDAPAGASEDARPFASADEAWIWTMGVLLARRDGAGPITSLDAVARPCEPDDVVRCLDRLYRQRRIDLAHARVLRIWGERQTAPPERHHGDRRLWREAMSRLDWPLRQKGIVATPTSSLFIEEKLVAFVTGPVNFSFAPPLHPV